VRQPTGSSGVGLSYTEENYGEAFEREGGDSEFGLPENFDDPYAYRGKTPPMDEPQVGR